MGDFDLPDVCLPLDDLLSRWRDFGKNGGGIVVGNRKRVTQYDAYGRKLREFLCAEDAAKFVDGLADAIQKCCRGTIPVAYGFRWKYSNDAEDVTDIDYSMIMERAAGEIANIICLETSRAKKQVRAAKDAGEPVPEHLQVVMDGLRGLQKEFRQKSDEAFEEHKRSAETYDDGLDNLANAIIERMALDFETAICNGDDGTINEIRNFAEKKANKYTNLDIEDVLSRIVAYHERFKRKAHNEIDDIVKVTNAFRSKRHPFGEENNPHRCPLCGGGMYVKTKCKSNVYLVGCTGCNLTEVVTVRP